MCKVVFNPLFQTDSIDLKQCLLLLVSRSKQKEKYRKCSKRYRAFFILGTLVTDMRCVFLQFCLATC